MTKEKNLEFRVVETEGIRQRGGGVYYPVGSTHCVSIHNNYEDAKSEADSINSDRGMCSSIYVRRAEVYESETAKD